MRRRVAGHATGTAHRVRHPARGVSGRHHSSPHAAWLTEGSHDIRDNLVRYCAAMDHQAIAALITDLKSRGLLEETLIVWIGEFGRTPFREGRIAGGPYIGRDHHPFSNGLFMANGGLKAGLTHGKMDKRGSQHGRVQNAVLFGPDEFLAFQEKNLQITLFSTNRFGTDPPSLTSSTNTNGSTRASADRR